MTAEDNLRRRVGAAIADAMFEAAVLEARVAELTEQLRQRDAEIAALEAKLPPTPAST